LSPVILVGSLLTKSIESVKVLKLKEAGLE
jgi:hypothetical protein